MSRACATVVMLKTMRLSCDASLAGAVYEHLVFKGHSHLSIRSLPGMAERKLRIGSAGKTFSFTFWKVHPSPPTLRSLTETAANTRRRPGHLPFRSPQLLR